MDRFVAFLWEADRPDRIRQVARWFAALRAKRPDWSTVHDSDGLLVVALPDAEGVLPACRMSPPVGVIIGTIFANGRESQGALRQLPPDEIEQIAASRGDLLLRNYWGSYVGLVRESASTAVHVVRDPCGASACYRLQAKGITLLCSFVDDIADLPGLSLSVDWDAIRAFLVSNFVINSRTGLRELTELMPGQRMTWRPDAPLATTWIWNPIAFAERPKRRSFNDACAEFRAVAERCTEGWARAGGSTLVRMSGGLDSSIVAGLVRRSSTDTVTGVHFAGRGYEAYERDLARRAAAHLGISLVEQTFDPATAGLRSGVSGPRLARPTKQILGADVDQMLQDVCDATGAQTVVSGHGGDALFLQRSIAGDVVVDYLLTGEPKADLPRVAYDTAVLLESSIWQVVGDAASQVLGRRRWDFSSPLKDGGARAHQNLASEAFFEFAPGSITSIWLEEARRLPPCKAEQLRSIVALRNYHATRGHAVARRSIHPLISQPLIELSLGTPAHLFNTGGSDRALERNAFADLVPEAVARRFHKGFVNHSVIASIVEDLGYIRDLVLNGRCMDNGLLDRAKVERLLSPQHLLEGAALGAVMDLVTVESWLMPWLGP